MPNSFNFNFISFNENFNSFFFRIYKTLSVSTFTGFYCRILEKIDDKICHNAL